MKTPFPPLMSRPSQNPKTPGAHFKTPSSAPALPKTALKTKQNKKKKNRAAHFVLCTKFRTHHPTFVVQSAMNENTPFGYTQLWPPTKLVKRVVGCGLVETRMKYLSVTMCGRGFSNSEKYWKYYVCQIFKYLVWKYFSLWPKTG